MASGSRAMVCSLNSTVAPTLSGTKSSRAKMSNENVVNDNRRASPSMDKVSAMPQVKLHNAWCRTITPLGVPVEPEV
ncbi:hypothetical protein [Pseudomonas sp. 24 E 13]|nr:hypothetical protein [Pseudomonas sp. 24 E 13]CRM62300.1 hypothetical protein [Pseudomonas sp. 44 R 15]